jgi:hypothetical protein
MSLSKYKKLGFVCMDQRLNSTRTIARILFLFGIQGTVSQMSTPGEYEHASSKNSRLSDTPQNNDFLENCSNDLD